MRESLTFGLMSEYIEFKMLKIIETTKSVVLKAPGQVNSGEIPQ